MIKDRKFAKAWLIFSRGKIQNIFSSRKDGDFVFEYIKDLYSYENFTLREKAVQADYANGSKYRKDFFEYGGIPKSTPHTSNLYREMMIATRDDGIDSPKAKDLWMAWCKQPFSYKIGEPERLIEARQVYDLIVSGENGKGVLEWNEHNTDGELIRQTYRENT